MAKKSYFLQLENVFFRNFKDGIVDNGIKIIVPSEMNQAFKCLHTEKNLAFPGTSAEDDYKAMQEKYEDYDVFCLLALHCGISNYPFGSINADLRLLNFAEPEAVAFVCIPKNCKKYIEDTQWFLTFVKQTVTEYCNFNRGNCCSLNVMENKTGGKCVSNAIIDTKIESWVEESKIKYGISQQEIDNAKELIKSLGTKNLDNPVYKITSDKDQKWIVLG